MGCESASFKDGKYTWRCATCCGVDGTYEYRAGRIYLHLTMALRDNDDPAATSHFTTTPISDYQVLRFGRSAGQIICLEAVSDPAWPGNRKVVASEVGGVPQGWGVPQGCFYLIGIGP